MKKDSVSMSVDYRGNSAQFEEIRKGIDKEIAFLSRGGNRLNKEDLEDIRGEAILKALTCGNFDPSLCTSPSAYGARIALNCFNSYVTSAYYQHLRNTDSYYYGDDDEDYDPYCSVGDYRCNEFLADSGVHLDDINRVVDKVLAESSDIDRTIYEMILEQYAPREICEIVGLTSDAVSVRLHRLRKKLKAELRDYLNEYGMAA